MRALIDHPLASSVERTVGKRKLAAILHADVAGFSRLMGEDEAGTHRALGTLRNAVDPVIASHGGRIVGTAGDSLLADFASVVDATSCAVEMQRVARAINDPMPVERRLELRIGVNLGDVIVDGDDIFGDGVNIAARLEALAQPGTVCISQNVYDQVRNKLDLDYRPLGLHRVKNIAESVRAYAVGVPAAAPRRRRQSLLVSVVAASVVVAAGLVVWAYHAGIGREVFGLAAAPKPVEIAGSAAPAQLGARPALAVLPFENLSGDASQDFFSDGMTEDIITALGRFSNLLVIAKSASFQFRGQKLAPAELGRRLDVRYLLDGSVRRAGDRVRVAADLIEAATGRQLWSQTYDAEAKDIFGVQQDIASRVVGAASVKLARFERDRALGKPTQSLAAYEYVLRGREVFAHTTREGNREAQNMFQRAIGLDPSYAEAYAGLGLSLVEAVSAGWTEFIADDLGRAQALAQKALTLDPSSAAARRLLAHIYMTTGRFDLAIDETKHAIEINPNDPESMVARGEMLLWAGRAGDALPWLQGALRLDPTGARADFLLGMTFYFLSRHGEAVEAITRGLSGNVGRAAELMGRTVLAAAYAQLDRPGDAARERAAALRLSPLLGAERFAGQFGTPEARDHMLDGLKKAGFR
jgi:TolB-like protein/class 3 adenylate cyclase/cytochrome c-type biogenesis protein CcmH/NrfG